MVSQILLDGLKYFMQKRNAIRNKFHGRDLEPSGPPWALSEREIAEFHALNLQEIRRKVFLEGDNREVTKLWIEYRKS